jgi:hypothetical protein
LLSIKTGETIGHSSNHRSFGMDESFPTTDQRWRSSVTSAHSPEKSESRVTTGDTGENVFIE